MPYVSPAAVVSGAVISKTTFGDVVKADLDYLANPPACRVYHNVTQSIPNATETTLAFNTERYDTANLHDTVTNNSRITIPTAGLYQVALSVGYGTNNTGFRYTYIRLNGTTYLVEDSRLPNASVNALVNIGGPFKFAAGDYIEGRVYQTSGGALVVEAGSATLLSKCDFAATWIGLG